MVYGDATKLEDVQKLMAGAKAAIVGTGPPENVAVESVSARLATKGRWTIMNDVMPAEEFAGFLNSAFLVMPLLWAESRQPFGRLGYHSCNLKFQFYPLDLCYKGRIGKDAFICRMLENIWINMLI